MVQLQKHRHDRDEIYLLAIQLSYRLDAFAEHFPIAPVVRAGVDYYLWRILNGDGEVANFDATHQAMGGTHGWHYAIDFHLLLDALASDMARDFQYNAGVQNSFITFSTAQARLTILVARILSDSETTPILSGWHWICDR